MKKLLCLATAGLLTITLTGCPQATTARKVSTEDVKRETREAVDTAKQFASQKKAEYEKQLQQQLDEMDKDLQQWRAKADKATGDAKAEMEKKLKALQEQRDALAGKIKDLGKDSGEAWEEMKKGIDKAWGELKEGFDKARDSFK